MAQRIIGSVGENGTNIPADVALIQIMLNDAIAIKGLGVAVVPVNGVADGLTVNAIRTFQQIELGSSDGRIDPGKGTLRRLNGIVDGSPQQSPITARHRSLYESGTLDLGQPAAAERSGADGVGLAQAFEYGSIYYHPVLGAYEVHGLILQEYLNMGEEGSLLGYPFSDEKDWPQGGGRASDFLNGSIYWSLTGDVEVLETPPDPAVLPFESNVSENRPAFTAKVRTISAELGVSPDWLMVLMHHESGLNHRIKNSIGCVGLIQFCPSTIPGLGTTADALTSMSNVEQLDYVRKYYLPHKNKMHSYVDLYLATFYPIAFGRPDSFVFGSQKDAAEVAKVTKANKSIDLNKDGGITLAEFKQWVYSGVPDQVLNRVL
jgi:hypothetical protein